MVKLMLFGTGSFYKSISDRLNFNSFEFLGFLDNDKKKIGSYIGNKIVLNPGDVYKYEYDFILITSSFKQDIKKQLIDMGVDEARIILPETIDAFDCWDFGSIPYAKLFFINKHICPTNMSLMKQYFNLIELVNKVDYRLDDRLNVIVSINEVEVNVKTFEELYIIYEIWGKKVYNFTSNDDGYFVFDIGMNSAFASLFFASNSKIKRVFSFEPFYETFKYAISNLELNPKQKRKIDAYNYGVGDKSEKVVVNYDESNKGSMTLNGLGRHIIENDSIVTTVEVRDIKEILNELLPLNKDSKVVFKIDCEGCEYEIIKRLCETGLMNEIDIFLIEWHYKGYEPLQVVLEQNGFKVFSNNETNFIGMIYATR